MALSTSNRGGAFLAVLTSQDISKNPVRIAGKRVGGRSSRVRQRRRLGSKKLGKLTFRLRAETDKRADIFSRLDGFIERASRDPIENDENWTDVHMRKRGRKKERKKETILGGRHVASRMHLEFYHRSCSRCRDGLRFSGRARDSVERETRSVTQSGDRRPVDFDKRTDAILPESGSFVRFGSANRNSRRRSDIRPIRDIPRRCWCSHDCSS